MPHRTLKQKVHSLSLNIQAKDKSIPNERYPVAFSDDGFAILRAEELAAILADLNQLINTHIPARAVRNAVAYSRSREIVAVLDDALSRY